MNDPLTPYSTGQSTAKAFAGFLVLAFPLICTITSHLLSTPVNRTFNYEKECTIESVTGTSSDIQLNSPDCSDLEFKGSQRGLNDSQVIERINDLVGQKVTVNVGYWQTFSAPTMIVGIEGLDFDQ